MEGAVDDEPSIRRWYVGLPPGGLEQHDGLVAFTEQELVAGRRTAALALGFHEAAGGCPPRSPEVHIAVPAYRGKRLVPLLAWMAVERLAAPGGLVIWSMTKQQGPNSVRAFLEGLGWDLDRKGGGGSVRLSGRAPAGATLPEPHRFTADLGARPGVRLAADFGVFSPERIDDGTALLLDVALGEAPVSRVADIGVGYGALAIGLVLNGVASSAVGTDVDAIALWLAEQNARTNAVPLELILTADPLDAGPASLTVANVPTHIDAASTTSFMAGLAQHARHGRLLIVVHAALERRYLRYLSPHGPVQRYPGPAHVVLGIGSRESNHESASQ
jgi:16S rRNA G1207 methylase RsmC